MIFDLIKFPLWKNDGQAIFDLNSLQKEQIENFKKKVRTKKYKFINNPCLCGNIDRNMDILITEKDRYGIPCDNVLCRNCGLIRLKERLDDYSTAEFYKNEYRDIYVGQEQASDKFFLDQSIRGEVFLSLTKDKIDFNKINSVFEIGCGAGGILYPFHKVGKKVSGCDFGEKYLKYGQNKGLNLYQGELDENKTLKESQDLIILSHVMEHFNDPIKTMTEIIEYIKPEKYLLVEVPGIFNVSKTYYNPILYFQNAHVFNFYYDYLKVLFETLGLKVVYGDERCTFILQKPANWFKEDKLFIDVDKLNSYSYKIEKYFKKCYLQYSFKVNPYFWRIKLVKILKILKLKK